MKRYLILLVSVFFLSSKAQTGFKNITWVLYKIEDTRAKTTVIINHDHSVLRFDDSTYAGYGCNAYSGKYKIKDNQLYFYGGMQITNQDCVRPTDAKAEDYIMKDFVQLEYKLVDEKLILNDKEVIFTFNKQKK